MELKNSFFSIGEKPGKKRLLLTQKNSKYTFGLQSKVLFLLVLIIVFFSGCILFPESFESEIAKFNDLKQRFALGEQLAPGNQEQITLFKAELSKMQSQTKNESFSSFLDTQLNIAETVENFYSGTLEFQRVNTVNVDCRENSPLNKTISALEKAFNKSDLAIKRIEAFKNSYPDLTAKANLPEERITALKQTIKEQLDSAKALKSISCT